LNMKSVFSLVLLDISFSKSIYMFLLYVESDFQFVLNSCLMQSYIESVFSVGWYISI